MLALRPIGVQNEIDLFRSIRLAMAHAMAPTFSSGATSAAPPEAAGRSTARSLTDAAIRSLRDGESRTDGSLPVGAGRLIVECRKSRGTLRKRWLFRYRTAGSSGKLVLGDYPGVGLEEARTKARAHIEQVRTGVDPQLAAFEEKQTTIRAEREKAALGSLRLLLAAYVGWLRAKGKSSAQEVERLFERHVLAPWPQVASMPARAVTAEIMRDVLARMVKAGIGRQTNIVRSYLHAAFVHGAHADLDPRRAAEQASTFRLTSNPMQLLPRIAEFETTRDRVLTDSELRALWMALDGQGGEVAATVRCLILLAGQRFRQLLRATWRDYNRTACTLRLTDPKGKRTRAAEHLLPLPTAVVRELNALANVNGNAEFIFSATGGAKPIHHTTISTAIGRIARRGPDPAGGYRPGDLRRTVETRLQALGVSRDVRAQLLSHGRSSGVQARHYERHDFLDEKRSALLLWESHLKKLLRNEPKEAVSSKALASAGSPSRKALSSA